MIYCPRCQSETIVYDSRPTTEGTIRRRKCKNCGFRFRTTEKYTGRVNNFREPDTSATDNAAQNTLCAAKDQNMALPGWKAARLEQGVPIVLEEDSTSTDFGMKAADYSK